MTEMVVALLMIVNGEIKEHRIQIDPKTGKYSMAMCLKGKRYANRGEKNTISECLKGSRVAKRQLKANSNVKYQCIKSMAELELNIDGSKSIKKLILK